jgi:hypothetical protein
MTFQNRIEPCGFTVRRPACLLVYADLKKLVGRRLSSGELQSHFIFAVT